MNARHRDVSTETGTSLDAEGPLRRWARRRREVAREEEALAEARRRVAPQDRPQDRPEDGTEAPETGADATEPAGVEDTVLTDEDMPSLESLDDDSDYSGFLSPGVSERLRRRALRKLFTSAVFNVPDGLDDYDDDFRSFEALGDIVTSDMRHQAEVEEERARQAGRPGRPRPRPSRPADRRRDRARAKMSPPRMRTKQRRVPPRRLHLGRNRAGAKASPPRMRTKQQRVPPRRLRLGRNRAGAKASPPRMRTKQRRVPPRRLRLGRNRAGAKASPSRMRTKQRRVPPRKLLAERLDPPIRRRAPIRR